MNGINWADIVGLVTSIVTAVGVIVAGRQLALSKQQSRIQFEDGLAREYRELIQKIPVKALLGENLSEDEHQEFLHLFYHYIDLSNEQLFLRQKGRVGFDTWDNWQDGIKSNMSLPAFSNAWEEIKSKSPNRFRELRLLEARNYKDDPKDWNDGGSMISASASPNKHLQPTAK